MDAVIAGFVRTPFTFARKGPLAGVRPDDLAAVALRALVERSGVDARLIDDVLLGCGYPEGAQGNNVARVASMLAGLPVELGAVTLNRSCGSSMSAIHFAAGQIAIGAGEAFIAGGVESMTMVPPRGGNFSPNPRFASAEHPDAELAMDFYLPMGLTAENVAARYGVTRVQQDEFALESQQKAAAAQAAGRLADELVPVRSAEGVRVERDGCLRPDTTLAALAGLKPAFAEHGTVTAGSSSPLTDGASATLITSAAFAARHGLRALGRIKSTAVAGCAPEYMGLGPIEATRKALRRAGLEIGDIDVVEINEAFAAQVIPCLDELGIDRRRVNLDGGAIALGHPAGATGARLTAKAAQILQRQGGRYALATQCIGGGQGIATIVEAV